jgi:hypothetical protein
MAAPHSARSRLLCQVALLLFSAVTLVNARPKKGDDSGGGADRMKAEIDARDMDQAAPAAPQSPEMAAKEAEALKGMATEIRDSLTDIMAVLQHGSDGSKEGAIETLLGLAVSTGEAGKEQARMFRSAVVAGGALPPLIDNLDSADLRRQALAASALHALALDDPDTDADNFHQSEICQAGAVPALVKLLSSAEPQIQHAATGALSTLAENPTCQAMIAAEGAVQPLVEMAQYGSDMLKVGALGALEVLSVNNKGVREELTQQGAPKMLEGLAGMGSTLLREEAGAFGARLSAAPEKLSADAHVKAARQTRVRYDGIRQRAFRLMNRDG